MARPPFTIKSAEVSILWDGLSKLLQQEQERNMLDEIQQSVGHLPFAAEVDGSPTPTIDCIKFNLGIERDFNGDIEAATEAYNIAVCRTIGSAMHSTLPRELRDMIYEYLTTRELEFHTEFPNDIYIHVRGSQFFSPYFVSQPRSQDDKLCPERYWRDDVVSSEVAYELMESWYRNSKFGMHYLLTNSEESHEFLKALLNKDRFDKGLQPHELITKFTHSFYLGHDGEGVDENMPRCLDEMSLLVKSTLLRVRIRVRYRFQYRDEAKLLKEHLALIRPTILRLRVLGHRCAVSSIPPKAGEFIGKVLKEWEQELEAEIKNSTSMVLTET